MIQVFKSESMGHLARTLPDSVIGTHPSGWTIIGEVREDYYYWVNLFAAIHMVKGWVVCGDFEDEVYATSQEAFDHFLENHPFSEWDYYDI